MPRLTKLSNEEVEAMKTKKSKQSKRVEIRREYTDYLRNFKPGDWVKVELDAGEKRQTVKNRLKAAAKELGYQLNFTRTRGSIQFEIQESEK